MKTRKMTKQERKNIIEQPVDIRSKFIKEDLKTLEENFSKLTVWEMEFFESIHNQFNEGKNISQKQFNTLQEIADKLGRIKY